MKPSVPHTLVLCREEPMSFRIDYYRKGERVGAVPYPGSREQTLDAAANGLKRHDADIARILDMDHQGKEVGNVTSASFGYSKRPL